MKKVLFGIFAHPDDEAFGPAGTLLMEKAAGSEVHLICATAGEGGMNPDNLPNLAEVRLEEWRHAGGLIGADSMHHLGQTDGKLCNSEFHTIASQINAIVSRLTDDRDDIVIEFMTIDLNGITGHLDHIAIARIACYVFCTRKAEDERFTRLRLACVSRDHFPNANCSWLYMDAGRREDEITETIDASEHLETIRQIIATHRTQRSDAALLLDTFGDGVAINHFLVLDD